MSTGQPVRFVIFAAPRTGSNLLCSLFNAHPEILCHHGLFNPGGIHWARGWQGSASLAARDRDPASFIAEVWASCGDARAIGFKMNRDENDDAVCALLHDPSVRKILLRRRNRVRTYVSEEIAKLTGVWETYDSPADPTLPAVHVEADDLIRHSALNTAYYAMIEEALRASGQPWLDTHYEALGDSAEMAGILSFLGIAAQAPLSADSHKRAPVDLDAVVENFDELAGALQGTALLDDLYRRDMPELHHLAFTP